MSDPYRYPGMAHVPAQAANQPPERPVPPDMPNREERKVGMEVAAVFLQGQDVTDRWFIATAKVFAQYIHDGKVPEDES